jgi:hypothetical protein
MTRLSSELALPLIDDRCASFLKFEAKHQQKWSVIKNKLNFVLDLQGGMMATSVGSECHKSFVNDRFYLHNTSGYLALGHNEPSNRPPSLHQTTDAKLVQKEAKQILTSGLADVRIGDDLGADRYLYTGARFDFIDVPLLRDYNCRLYSAAEAIWYPSFKQTASITQSLRQQTRFSLGFGINMPLNDFFSIALYYNAANFGSQLGDIERSSIVNLTFCFF